LELPDSIPAGQSIEGYLFPDTYDIAKDADARKLAQMMVRQFDRKLNPQLRQRAASNGLSVHQVVTLASIVEREAARPAEQPIIASVYLNRLNNNMPLQADPTIQFAVATADPARALEIGFWKRELTRDDLQVSSAYNTYLVHGLPPGPICSPGLDAVEAVLNPSQTDYYYFVARGDGSHAFARTEAEHRANVERHQASQ
ncbi:MAG TPA: endolytic transglycosylase MltG, partial [Chloroflexota bacterium]|nr:endolytic transglycosylase MltG [Chloroflexota bacterium]